MSRQRQMCIMDSVPGAQINGAKKNQSPSILNAAFPELDGERAVFALDQQGIFVSTGSACAANSGIRSHVLLACGLSDGMVDGSLRISFGRGFSENDLAKVKPIFVKVLREQMKFGQETVAQTFRAEKLSGESEA